MNTGALTAARVFFLLLHALPAAAAFGWYGAHAIWLPTSLILGLLLLATLDATKAGTGRATVCVLSGALATASCLLAVSFYFQGEAFNQRFFFHAEFGSLRIAIAEYRAPLAAGLAVVALAFVIPGLLQRRRGRPLGPVALASAWLLALAVHYPVYALVRYAASVDEVLPAPTPPVAVAASPEAPAIGAERAAPAPKNIVLIYAESLERTFFDRAAFGTLMPEIAELADRALEFTNLGQVKGTGWTVGGIVASQCGFPVMRSSALASNSSMASAEDPFAGHACLADILADNGYRNVFLGGAPLWFGGKGKFLRAHGYHEVYGREELVGSLEDASYVSGWGLFDDSLFDLAADKLVELERGETPYFLTVLTLDTHHPRGNPSRSCTPLPDNDDPISNAIFCSDQLVAKFIRTAMSSIDPERTMIVLFSDHLAMRNTLFPKLRSMRPSRRLMLMLFGAGFDGTIDTPGNHFDVAPTVLSAAGIGGFATLNLGRNLLDVAAGAEPPPVARTATAATPRLFPTAPDVRATGALLSAAEPSIKVGDLTVRANAEGAEFDDGLFLAVFGEQGELIDTVYSKDFAAVLAGLEDRFVIGFSRFADAPRELSYFYGRLSERGENVVIAPIEGEVRLSAVELAAAYQAGASTDARTN